MPRTSAGLLPFRWGRDELEVFIAHMGGPLWARRDDGGWSIVKGEFDPTREDARVAADREFTEETGTTCPAGDWLDLGSVRQPSGKVVRTFAAAVDHDLSFVRSNDFRMEWPRGSGRVQAFPEIDRAEWFPVSVARTKLVGGQRSFLDRLLGLLGEVPASEDRQG